MGAKAMGKKQSPSSKDAQRILTLLERGAVSSTGGFGRLCGKIAAKLNLSIATVAGVLNGNDNIDVFCDNDGTWNAKLRLAQAS